MPAPNKYALDTRNDGRGYKVLAKTDRNGRPILEHTIIAERILGRPMPKGACVHHHNGNGRDNTLSNLVICPNQKYHELLHTRITAKMECGDANLRKCWICKEYSSIDELRLDGRHVAHSECIRQLQRAWHFKNKTRINARIRKARQDRNR